MFNVLDHAGLKGDRPFDELIELLKADFAAYIKRAANSEGKITYLLSPARQRTENEDKARATAYYNKYKDPQVNENMALISGSINAISLQDKSITVTSYPKKCLHCMGAYHP